MTELDVLDHFSDGRSDYLGPEIAELLTTEHRETVDELKLAALLGKTLLEKNGELELKLKRLQEFAEETLAEKQTISRQVSESRDSLHFLNRTCEQLEAKVEELEAANEELCKACEDRQVVIEQKNAVTWELKEKLESLEEENKAFREELKRVKQSPDKTERSTTDTAPKGPTGGHRAHRLCSENHHHQQDVLLKRIAELQQELDLVSQKLRNAHYQRQKLQKELGEVLEENQLLCKELEKVEQESMELQTKLTLQEEASERQYSLESSLSSSASIRRHRSMSTHSNGLHDRFLLRSPAPEDQRPPKTPLDLNGPLGISLFSELDTQHTTLHRQYSELLRDCTCSASLAHKMGYQLGVAEVDSSSPQSKRQNSQTDKPFKELFDEVFATLKQTAQVADRLIERRSSTLDQR